MQILVVERTQQIMLQEQEITRREKELEAKVKKPAEAERYRLEKLADAQRWVPRLGRKNPICYPSIISVSLLFCPCVMKKFLSVALFAKLTFVELRGDPSNSLMVKSYRGVHSTCLLCLAPV